MFIRADENNDVRSRSITHLLQKHKNPLLISLLRVYPVLMYVVNSVKKKNRLTFVTFDNISCFISSLHESSEILHFSRKDFLNVDIVL